MKPVYANYFMCTANRDNGECILNVFHNYPSITTDGRNLAANPQDEVNTEQVASIVMTHADAQILADVLQKTLQHTKVTVNSELNPTNINLGGH